MMFCCIYYSACLQFYHIGRVCCVINLFLIEIVIFFHCYTPRLPVINEDKQLCFSLRRSERIIIKESSAAADLQVMSDENRLDSICEDDFIVSDEMWLLCLCIYAYKFSYC